MAIGIGAVCATSQQQSTHSNAALANSRQKRNVSQNPASGFSKAQVIRARGTAAGLLAVWRSRTARNVAPPSFILSRRATAPAIVVIHARRPGAAGCAASSVGAVCATHGGVSAKRCARAGGKAAEAKQSVHGALALSLGRTAFSHPRFDPAGLGTDAGAGPRHATRHANGACQLFGFVVGGNAHVDSESLATCTTANGGVVGLARHERHALRARVGDM